MPTTPAVPATPALPAPAVAVVLRDVDDLAEADRKAELADRLEEVPRPGAGIGPAVAGPADAAALARSIVGSGPAAVAAHRLGIRAALLATC